MATSSMHPLAGGSFSNMMKLLWAHRVEPKYFTKAAAAGLLSAFGAPGRQVSRLQFDKKAKALTFEQDPVFILGHWRSGTTYLHHLMGQDPNFCYVSSYQALAPEQFLRDNKLSRYFVEKNLPKKRPIDNVELSMQKPEEEEFVMANVSPHSYIHTFFFPKDAQDIFNKSILFEGITEEEKAEWEAQYVRSLKFASLGMEGKRALAKSPGNTGRISTLLKIFPDAKFVHIYRNPYVVFFSHRRTCLKLLEMWKLQDFDQAEVEANILSNYKTLMEKFFEERTLIPPNNLIEIRYEDFEVDQLNTLEKIYNTLELDGFDQAKKLLNAHIEANANYKKNVYNLDPDTIERVHSAWQFTIDKWGYEAP